MGSEIEISDSLTLAGPGQQLLTLDSGLGGDGLMNGNGHRLFKIDSGGAGLIDVDLQDLTMTGGDTNNTGGAIATATTNLTLNKVTVTENAGDGVGGVYHIGLGLLALVDSVFTENRHWPSGASDNDAGAIFGGDIDIIRSTFSDNESGLKGAGAVISLGSGHVLNIIDSTFFNNSSLTGGGAVRSRSGVNTNVLNSTFSGNTGILGAITQETQVLNVDHSTFSNNSLDIFLFGPDIANVSHSILMSVSGMLSTDTFNLIGGSPLLGPLADNGGPTQTHALLPGSPAIDMGDISFTGPPNHDQRGFEFQRVVGSRIDIGAFESGATSADFDSDGDVDGANFLAWQRNFGNAPAVHSDGDANVDGVIAANDLAIWESTFGSAAPTLLASQSDLTPVIGDQESVNLKATGGAVPSKRKITGYSILQAESMAAAKKLLKGHPHLAWIKGCEIEVHEAMPMG